MNLKRLLFLLLILSASVFAFAACKDETVSYTVSFELDGGSGSARNQSIESGYLARKPSEDPTKVGHAFLGWYYGEEEWDFSEDLVTSDITLTAKWEKLKYTVTFDTDGGVAVPSQEVAYGELATKPLPPTKKNFRFAGWFFANQEWNFDVTTITSDITITAKWTPAPTYTVTFSAHGAGETPIQHVPEGSTVTRPIDPDRPGYRFLGWYYGEELWDFDNNKITENITLEAKFEEIIIPKATITFETYGGTPISPIEVPIGSGMPDVITPMRNNADFLYWLCNGVMVDENFVVTEDCLFEAVYSYRSPIHPI